MEKLSGPKAIFDNLSKLISSLNKGSNSNDFKSWRIKMRQSLMTIIPLADENVIPKPDDLPEDEFTNWNNISVQLCYMVDEAVETGMAAKKAPKGNRKGEMTQWWSNHCMSNCFSLATIYTLLAHFTSTYDFSDKSLLEKVSHIIWARG